MAAVGLPGQDEQQGRSLPASEYLAFSGIFMLHDTSHQDFKLVCEHFSYYNWQSQQWSGHLSPQTRLDK